MKTQNAKRISTDPKRLSIMILTALSASAALALSSCQTAKVAEKAAVPLAYQAPQSADIASIVIMGTNDIHGALAPQNAKTREFDPQKAIPYTKGGAAILAAHIQQLRFTYGNRLILLNGGDNFQGTLESNLEEGAPVVTFMNSQGFAASSIGNHEFDFGPVGPEGTPGDPLGAIKARMSESKFQWVAANVLDKKTGKLPDFANTHPSVIVDTGSLRVGVIGLSTLQTPTTTRPTFVKDLEFTPLKDAVLRESKALREKGADLIVAVAHAGLFCEVGGARPGHELRTEKDPQGRCDGDDEIVQLLKGIPTGTLDAVVSGHTHSIVHHWVNGVPVIQAGARALYYNLIFLSFDKKNHRVLTDETRIEGPIPVCEQVFSHQGDCNGDAPAPRNGRGSLVTPVLHGQKIVADPTAELLLAPVFARVDQAKHRVVGKVEEPVELGRERESAMGNLVSDAVRESVSADVAIVNSGGLRAPFESGDLTFGDLFKTLPFDNSISLLQVNGRELKLILKAAESGAKGFFPTSGVTLTILHPDVPAQGKDLNGDGKIDLWEVDRLASVKFRDGSPIDDKKMYKLATIDFLVQGGDEMGWVFNQVPKDRISMQAGPMLRDAVESYITKKGILNSKSNPLVDPKNPRLIFTRVALSSKKGGGSRHRRKKHH